jgi:hypothetical protein
LLPLALMAASSGRAVTTSSGDECYNSGKSIPIYLPISSSSLFSNNKGRKVSVVSLYVPWSVRPDRSGPIDLGWFTRTSRSSIQAIDGSHACIGLAQLFGTIQLCLGRAILPMPICI